MDSKKGGKSGVATHAGGSGAPHYRVLHHVPGRIRLVVPGIRQAPLAELKTLARQLKNETIPGRVLTVRANPLTGSVTLTYDAAAIDILTWVEALIRRKDVAKVIGRRPA